MEQTRITRTAIHFAGALMAAVLAFGAMTSTPAHAATAATTSTSTITKVTAPGQPKFGDQGPTVVALQSAILANGFSLKGGATGKFNTVTRRALRTFQKVVGLRVTGVVDEATVAVLKLAIAPAATTTTIAPATTTTVAPATTTTVTPTTVFLKVIPKRGGKGKSVLTVQTALVTAGVTVRGGTDGVFGSSTAEAISFFQKSKGLAVTSTLTPDTVSALGLSVTTTTTVAPATTTTIAPATTATPVLLSIESLPKRGDKNDATRVIQTVLVAAGIEIKGGIDGVFGIATTIAVQKFQTAQNLSVTGRVDYATALKLNIVSPPVVLLDVFPVQGLCAFVDTWHAPRGSDRQHLGVDIIAPQGQLLYAAADGVIGKVTQDGPGKISGNALRLVKADGTYFFYAHMKSFAAGIVEGSVVKAGQVIGLVGMTGTGSPHLHFEVHPGGGEAVNPYPVVKAVDACSVTAPRVAPTV
jgi:peptidoglycan hydrolase-like protein with peptidoglycan-binding domain